jgi:hypothetical protein
MSYNKTILEEIQKIKNSNQELNQKLLQITDQNLAIQNLMQELLTIMIEKSKQNFDLISKSGGEIERKNKIFVQYLESIFIIFKKYEKLLNGENLELFKQIVENENK